MESGGAAHEEVGAYIAWKGWGADFGTLGRGDARYFTRELREANASRSISRILEIGYGNGAFLAYCRSMGWGVTGTELRPELVDMARRAGFDARAAHELVDIPDGEFDAVVALDVFEHIPPDESIPFLQELAKKLAPGGSIVLRFPNADSWIGSPLQHGDVTHVNAIGALKMEYYAQASALEIVRFRASVRRGFESSLIHGLHKYTAGLVIKVIAGFMKGLYFPNLPVVLSTVSVVCVLRRASADQR